MWSELAVAAALLLIVEGIVPFLNPNGLKRMLARVGQLSDARLRVAGLVSMSLGLVLLYIVR
jgi:hypothetical protein